MDNRFRLILCDIDGILSENGNMPLSAYTRKVIEKLHRAGYMFGLASGRSVVQLKSYRVKWGFDFEFEAGIALNGCSLYDGITNRVYTYFTLRQEWLYEILEFMNEFEVYPYIYAENITRFLKDDPYAGNVIRDKSRKVELVDDISQLITGDTPKLLFHVPLKEMEQVETYALSHSCDRYKAVRTQPTILEFINSRASKLYAIRKFCEMHGLSLSETVAFGDTSNDTEMLKGCGLGVCMANGSPDAKAAADMITPKSCLEDGFADFAENMFLR